MKTGRPPQPLEKRFWSRVQKTKSCWFWNGPRWKDGYGAVGVKQKNGSYFNEKAHRVSWNLTKGEIPNGMLVCHHCDIRFCVRPDHLFLGTYIDNQHDAMEKGRHTHGKKYAAYKNQNWASWTRGEKSRFAKLTESNVKIIRRIYSRKYGQLTSIGKQFGVTPYTIYCVVNQITWKHV